MMATCLTGVGVLEDHAMRGWHASALASNSMGGTSAACMFGTKKATGAGGADLWQAVGDAPAALARLETPMGPTEMTRVPLEEVGRFQGQRWWGEGQDEQWRSHFARRS